MLTDYQASFVVLFQESFLVVMTYRTLLFCWSFLSVQQGGRASGFKNRQDVDSYDVDGTRLFQVKGTTEVNTRAVQVCCATHEGKHPGKADSAKLEVCLEYTGRLK